MTKSATKKVRARQLRRGMTVVIDGIEAEIASSKIEDVLPGWPAQPYSIVHVEFVEGSGYVMGSYRPSEWISVVR